MSNPDGTTPSEVGNLPTRKATPQEQELIDDILTLYQLKPNHKAYSHYAETAVFHDPVSIAKGLDSVKSQFNGMPVIFAESNTQECAVLASSTPSKLQLNLTQQYFFKSLIPFKSKGVEKVMNSKLTFNMNKDGLIEEHIEEWYHEKNQTSEDGWWGTIQEARKKIDAKMVEATISTDPDRHN